MLKPISQIREQYFNLMAFNDHQVRCETGASCALHYCIWGAVLRAHGADAGSFPSSERVKEFLLSEYGVRRAQLTGEEEEEIDETINWAIGNNDMRCFDEAWVGVARTLDLMAAILARLQ